jgi:cell division protease FtsH
MKKPAGLARWTWLVVAVAWAAILVGYLGGGPGLPRISYSEFKSELAAGRVTAVTVSPTELIGTRTVAGTPRPFATHRVLEDDGLVRALEERGVELTGAPARGSPWGMVGWLVPVALAFGLFVMLTRGLPRQGPGSFMTVGQSKAKVYLEKQVAVTFQDVAGVDEAKEELEEVIEFLRRPERLRRLGGRLPKGVLLVGPPGTGKTLLARAVAGEAAVPFLSISGSEFVEMFVGVGAARVRDLFTQARSLAPCIIFIDELDALGKVRGMGPQSHDEREQTLNQLLVELDGFDPRTGVILMAATNRPEILDPALLRAGRFDRHVLVDRPDKLGRLAILRVHARGVILARPDEDLGTIAAMTPGLVGADLANLVNEAALLAVRRGKDEVTIAELQEAVERVVTGLEKRNRVLSAPERARVAEHEVGHALVALALPGLDPVRKISIIPRGIAALGYTLQVPTEERFLMTQGELEAKLAMLLGGRVAEELVHGDTSTGAEDDLLRATHIARTMVRAYGMSPRLGHVSFARERGPLLLGVDQEPRRGDYSEETARQIDAEVRRILDEQHDRVLALLRGRLPGLRAAAAALLARETLTGDELRAIVEGVAAAPSAVA